MAASPLPTGSDDDLVLVLLIIFMVASPQMTVAVPVTLPQMTEAKVPPPDEPLVLSIDKSGTVWLKNDMLAEPDELAARLVAAHNVTPDRAVSLRGDRAVVYGRLMEVMDAVQAAGFAKVSLATEPKGK